MIIFKGCDGDLDETSEAFFFFSIRIMQFELLARRLKWACLQTEL